MYARWPAHGATTGHDSSGWPASTHARQTPWSRWREASERYDERRRVNARGGTPSRRPRVGRVLPLESVPNFSEGRDRVTIDAIGAALATHARLLDVHADPDHNRSVFTVVGSERRLIDALLAAIDVARERIDLRRHEGAHPRIGAADVVPFVPVGPDDLERARNAALVLGERVGELGLPVFLYAPPERGPAFYRRGGVEELQRRLDEGELAPDFGPPWLDPSAGAVIVGARRPLIAFNVNLHGPIEAAREIASLVREGGGTGFPGVRALGLELRQAGLVQVSMNVEDWESAALHDIVGRIEQEARARGAEVAGSELVGLMPAGAAAAAAGAALRIDGFDASRVLELRLLDGVR
jgi:glutamate formiminotransferase